MKTLTKDNQTYYKYKVVRKDDNETKLFFKYNELKEYCGVPRSTLYKIFEGCEPKRWCSKYIFEQVRLPRHQLREIEY